MATGVSASVRGITSVVSRESLRVSEVVPFTDNIRDLSNRDGFQFEFRCERCGNGYRSAFQRDVVQTGQTIARGVGRLLGGSLGNLGYAAESLLDRSTNSSGKDRAMRQAVAEIAPRFQQCRGCGSWVCVDVCWNGEVGQCARCSPVVTEELAQLQAEARRRQLRERLDTVDMVGGLPLAQQAQPRCHGCGAQSTGGKFCAECGSPLALTKACRECTAENASSARFCAECGSPFG